MARSHSKTLIAQARGQAIFAYVEISKNGSPGRCAPGDYGKRKRAI
jgi:hypothetical protein